jgi:anti-anti-sigma factor
MPIPSTTRDGVTIVTPTGVIDTRTAQVFEATMVQAFGGGARLFAVDFGRVDLITSAGIRVLVMMAHRLRRGVGGLVLFGLSDRVRMVFEIGGLIQQFQFVGTEPQAIELLSKKPAASKTEAKTQPSRLSGLVLDLVCPDGRPRTSPGSGSPSALTAAVVDALAQGARSGPPGPGSA